MAPWWILKFAASDLNPLEFILATQFFHLVGKE
jgi:hypothetical protein